MEESFEEFMESVIEEDDAMADEGSLQLFANSASQARESIANPQNPEVLGYRILGRAAYLDPVLGAEAGLLLDLTSAPFRPGDQVITFILLKRSGCCATMVLKPLERRLRTQGRWDSLRDHNSHTFFRYPRPTARTTTRLQQTQSL
jgi:hypothetical protein